MQYIRNLYLVKVNSIFYRFSSCVFVLLAYHLFYLIHFPDFLKGFGNAKYGLPLVVNLYSVVLVLPFVVTYRKKYQWILRYLLILFVCLFVYTIIDLKRYPLQSFIDIRFTVSMFFAPISAVLFIGAFEDNIYKMIRFINIVTLIWNCIIIVQCLRYRFGAPFLFAFDDYFVLGMSIRNDSVQLSLGLFGNLFVVYNLALLFSRSKRKFWNLIHVVTGVTALIFVQQTKGYILTILACLMVIVYGSVKNKKIRIISCFLIIWVAVLVFSTDFINIFVRELFGSEYRQTKSYLNRVYELNYYMDCFKAHPVLGNGFAELEYYESVIRGKEGVADYTDVGFIGLLGRCGLFSIVFYLIPLLRIIYISIKKGKVVSHTMSLVLYSFTVYLIVTSGTLIITDQGRNMLFGFMIAFFEFVNVNKDIRFEEH